MKPKLPIPYVMWEGDVRSEDGAHNSNAKLRKARAVITDNPTCDGRAKHEVPYIIKFEMEAEADLLGHRQWQKVSDPFVEFMSDTAKNFLNQEKGEPA